MPSHDFFLQLFIILISARVLGECAARLKAPAVIGELMAGVILGPSLLGLIAPSEIIKLLAEIGIILLLFEVGLETNIATLVRTGAKSGIVAGVGFVAPFAFGLAVAWYGFHLPLLASLFIGGTLTATSIGITVRVLTDLKRQSDRESQIVLGAAVIDDILGVVLLALLYDFSTGGGISLLNTVRVMVCIIIFMVLAPVVAKVIYLVIKRFDAVSEIPGLLPSTMVALLLLFAWIAHAVGAPELLGGFAAGVAMSRSFKLPFLPHSDTEKSFTHRVEEKMKPIVHLFAPIFFVTVGLTLNLRVIDWGSRYIWILSLSLSGVAVAGKLLGGFLLRNEKFAARWAMGLAMIPRGEVGLIFAELGRTSGILDEVTHAAVVIVIALTTLFPPFVMRWFYNTAGKSL